MITIPQAAALLGVTRMTIWRRIQDGTLKAEKVSNTWIINEQDLKQFKPRKAGRPKTHKDLSK